MAAPGTRDGCAPRTEACIAQKRSRTVVSETPPSAESAHERDRLIAQLSEIAATATAAELAYIAAGDYGAQTGKHYAALRRVIFEQGSMLAAKDYWTPGEVIELAALVPADGRTFAIATAILMANALRDGDRHGAMSLRWDRLAATYSTLPPEFSVPLLSGFRWLADHVDDWTPESKAAIPSKAALAALADTPT